jgi:L-idonate 5-dehydrogenase
VAVGVPLGELAFAEPLSVALHSVNRAGSLLGKSVLVTGAGTIGCLTVIAARLAGAARIVVTDVVDRPLAMASEVGADATLRADQLPREPAELQGTLGEIDVALEVAGHPAAAATCLAAVVRGGRIVQVGSLPGDGIHLLANQIMVREIDYVGTFRFGVEFEWSVRYLAEGRVNIRPLLSGQYALRDALTAFRAATDKTKSTKVQLIGA